MTIINRLSLFFLVALAVVLIGFSATMYGLAYWHLHSQLDGHLESTIHVLIAAIEIHPDDVEWEPLERKVTLGNDPDLTQVRWALHDERNQLIDCSANLKDEFSSTLPAIGSGWRTLFRRVKAGHFVADIPEETPAPTSSATAASLPANRTATRKSFVLTVALSEEPVRATLSKLALAMSLVSVAIWFAAALWGRWMCKRALRPVTEMAQKARSLQQSPDSRVMLDVPRNNDELTELGQAFNQLLATLRDSIERQQRFAGDASHQLRTPLTAMLAAVDVAARHERSPEEYQRILAVVQRRGRDLQQIVEILLALTRQNLGAEALQGELFDLNAWCRERVDLWQSHRRRADIHLQLCATSPFVRLQPTLLGQVFDNLLDNACKYSDVGSPITIRTLMQDAQAVISIEDRGYGIPREDLDQILEPFFRSANARGSGEPGSGLGLTVAMRLAGIFAGRLQVESVEGRGSSFRIAIPLAVASHSLVPEPAVATFT